MKKIISSVLYIMMVLLCIVICINDANSSFSSKFEINVRVGPFAPEISHIQDYITQEDTATQPIGITIGDLDDDIESLSLFAESSNQTLVQNSNIVFSGTGANRSITITPTADESGSLLITIAVSDGMQTTTQKFTLNVIQENDPPEISQIIDQTIIEDQKSLPLHFTVADAEGEDLTILAISSDPTIVPNSKFNIKIDGTHDDIVQTIAGQVKDLSLTITPAAGQYGFLTMTIMISDPFDLTAITCFGLTINKARYLIETLADGSGAITPTNPIVDKNEQITLRMKPQTGHVVKGVWVDGEYKGKMPRFIFYSVNEPHKITALFGPPDQYVITAEVGTGGIINPAGNITLNAGEDQIFFISSNVGYELNDVKINGVSKGAIVAWEFQDVFKNESIKANFREVTPPTAAFSSNYTIGTVPLNVQFYDHSSIKSDYPGDEITGWLWDFGDNTPKSASKEPGHQYTDPGEYTVTLTATGVGGLTNAVSKNAYIVVQPETIYLNFFADQTQIMKGEIVKFDSQTNINKGATYLWDFGDGSTSNEKNPLHTYLNPGNYNVILTLSTSGNSKTKEKLSYIKISGRTITGRIFAGDSNGISTGSTIKHALVELWSSDSNPIDYTLSDQDGNYTFTRLPAKTGYKLHVYQPFGINKFFDQFYDKKLDYGSADSLSTLVNDLSLIDIVLKQTPQLGITGRVHNGISGFSNLEVVVISESANFFSAYTMTDENGYYTFTGLKDASDYIVNVYYDGAEYYYSIPQNESPGAYVAVCGDSVSRWEKATGVSPLENPPLKNIDIILCNSGIIKGNIYNSDHLPIKDVWVNAKSEVLDIENGNFTDENGEYTITGLTVVGIGEILTKGYVVEVPSVEYPYQVYNQVEQESKANRVSADNSTGIDFYLNKSSSISGLVTDKYNIPIPGVQVTAYSHSSPTLKQGFAHSDSLGKYTITSLPFADDYIVVAFSDYYPPQYYYLKTKDERSSATKLSMELGDILGIDFKLDEGGIIKGHVKIDDNGSTIPAANIWVDIRSKSDTNNGEMIQTDSNGWFELTGLDENINDYIIRVDISGYQPSYYNSTRPNTTVYTWDEAESIETSTDVERNILVVKGFKIQGRLTYDGKSIDGITVIAYSESGGSGSAVTNKNDNFNYEITGLPAGKYSVFISSTTYIDSTVDNIMLYSDVSDINFTLEVPERKIFGTVYGLEKDKKVNILIFTTQGNDSEIYELIGTGLDLSYTVSGLKSFSDYRMQIYSNDYPDQIYNEKTNITDADIIDLSSANSNGIDFTLTADVATIAGEVTFPGIAVFGDKAWIDVVSDSTGSQGGAEVQKTINTSDPFPDTYTITGLERAPDYKVHVWSDKYLTNYYDNALHSDDARLIDTTSIAKIIGVNFTLDPGRVISGKILDEYLKGVSDVYVEAASDDSDSVRASISMNDGTYIIKGLKNASDFKIKAMKPNVDVPFFFGSAGTVRDRMLASTISTIAGDQNEVNITLSEGLSIAGTIRSENNTAILNEQIWVRSKSDTLQVDVGGYANSDGTYSIHGLPPGQDYAINVQPDSKSSYIGKTKNNVSSGSVNVDFYLVNGKQIEGYVKNSSGEAIRNVRIDICSTDSNIGKWVMTNTNGAYAISGLPPGNDYILTASPPDNSDYVEVTEYDLIIQTNTRKNITLTPAMKFIGYVYKEDGITPINGAWISVFSKESSDFMKGESTNSQGYFEITNIPDANDYAINVSGTGYQSQVLSDQSPGGNGISFTLKEAGTIEGTVKDTNGQALSGARVVAKSSQISNVYIVETNTNGQYVLKGLKEQDNFGNPITNYVITAEKSGYMYQSKGQKKPGDEVSFSLSKGGKISGTIYDELNNKPPGNFTITVFAFEKISDDELENPIKVTSDASGEFSFSGLDTNTQYILQFKSSSTGNLIKKIQWYGSGGYGVKKFNGEGSDEEGPSISITPDSTLNFNFRGTWE